MKSVKLFTVAGAVQALRKTIVHRAPVSRLTLTTVAARAPETKGRSYKQTLKSQ